MGRSITMAWGVEVRLSGRLELCLMMESARRQGGLECHASICLPCSVINEIELTQQNSLVVGRFLLL
jgi:hypothetical protein